MSPKKPTFEEGLKKLEEIVSSIDEGQLNLDESLKSFEEGMKLVKMCEDHLNQAEKKIETLMKNKKGELELTSFSEEDE